MAYIGTKPADKPLTSADITDGIIVNADIANSTINLTTKVTGTLPLTNGGTGLATLGTASQQLRVNSGATALEYYTPTVASSDYVLLETTTASGSATSVSFDGYFSSTYDNYIIYGYNIYSSATGGDHTLRSRLRRSNANIATSNYAMYRTAGRSYSGGQDTGNQGGNYNEAEVRFNENTQTESTAGANVYDIIINLFDPLGTTNYKYALFNFVSHSATNAQFHSSFGGFLLKDNTNALSGINIFVNSGNIYGKFKLYGIK